MLIVHTLEVSAVCPVDNLPDVYSITVECRRIVPVEAVIEVARSFEARRLYQEELTQEMARALAAKVTSVGLHSGVRTEVVCNGR